MRSPLAISEFVVVNDESGLVRGEGVEIDEPFTDEDRGSSSEENTMRFTPCRRMALRSSIVPVRLLS